MRRIIVLNAKGGCGKTTVATNLASSYAIRGFKTALIHYDPQESSMQWLRSRSPDLPRIQGIAIHDASRVPLAGAWQLRIPRDTQRVVVDTPAGLRAMDLAGRITAASPQTGRGGREEGSLLGGIGRMLDGDNS